MSRDDARARIEPDYLSGGVRVHLRAANGTALSVGEVRHVTYDPNDFGREPVDVRPLPLSEPLARALYEALAEHYGHTGHDMRALRKDLDGERARVDRLIEHVTVAATDTRATLATLAHIATNGARP